MEQVWMEMDQDEYDEDGGGGDGVFEEETELEDAVQFLFPYLHLKDLKALRQLNTKFHTAIGSSPYFTSKCTGLISTKWYSDYPGLNQTRSILKFKHFKMNHFLFYRNNALFPPYWAQIGNSITHLTLANSSFECFGFSTILNACPNLDSLVLKAFKGRDLTDYHNTVVQSPLRAIVNLFNNQPQGNPQPANYCPESFPGTIKHLTFDNCNYIESCFLEYLVKRIKSLESLAVISCFHPKTTNPYIHRQRPPRALTPVASAAIAAGGGQPAQPAAAAAAGPVHAGLQRGPAAANPIAAAGGAAGVAAAAAVADNDDAVDPTQLESLFNIFRHYLKKLLVKNQGTLKKLNISNNNFNKALLPIVNSIQPQLKLDELVMAVPNQKVAGMYGFGLIPINPTPQVKEFFNHTAYQSLEHLSMELHSNITNDELNQILEIVTQTLKSLRLRYNHDNIIFNSAYDFSEVSRMHGLEQLEITDMKKSKKMEVKPLFHQRKGVPLLTEEERQEILGRVGSKVNMEFLCHLPPGVRSLKLARLVTPTNYLLHENQELQSKLVASLKNLTKLELKGPWIHHPMQATMDLIFGNLKQLESLSLANCNLTDAHLTGLSSKATYELRHSSLIMHPLFAIRNPVGGGGDNKGGGGGGGEEQQAPALKPCLTDLQELKSLDLSQNNGISNVTLCILIIPKLKKLNVSSCRHINDSGLELISRNLPGLEELNIKYDYRTSQLGYNCVINACKHLKRLFLTQRMYDPLGAANRRNSQPPAPGVPGAAANAMNNPPPPPVAVPANSAYILLRPIPLNLHYHEILTVSYDDEDEELAVAAAAPAAAAATSALQI